MHSITQVWKNQSEKDTTTSNVQTWNRVTWRVYCAAGFVLTFYASLFETENLFEIKNDLQASAAGSNTIIE